MAQQTPTKIGVATATIIGMNAMIGSGIFTAPATMAAYVGPAGILAYLFVIIAVWCMSLSLARLAGKFPEEGSFYIYAKQWGGHTIGMLSSSSYMIGLFIAMGLLSQMAGFYLFTFFPAASPYTLGLIVLISLIILNLFGVVLSQLGQHILIVCTLFPLLTTIVMCLLKADLSNLTPFAPYGFTNVLKATRIVIFGFFGFECAASLFNIVHNPQRNVPRALTYSIIIVGLIYCLYISSLILSTPLQYFSDPRTPISETLALIFPGNTWILTIIHGAILSAVLGTIHSMIWSSSALLISLFKKTRGKLHNLLSLITPKMAVLIVGFCIFTSFTMINNMDLFFSLTALCVVFAYMTSMISLLTIKEEWESRRNIVTILGLVTASAIFYFAFEGLVQEIMNIL